MLLVCLIYSSSRAINAVGDGQQRRDFRKVSFRRQALGDGSTCDEQKVPMGC